MRRRRILLAAAVLALLHQGPTAGADSTDRPLPCRGVVGRWDGRDLRGGLCVATDDHVVASIAGNLSAACGTIVGADLNVLDGPTAGPGPGLAATDCPAYAGWPVEVHDPHIATEAGVHYLFSTGPGIPIRRSTDLRTWEPVDQVFPAGSPPWAARTIPGSGDPWAPSVVRFGGRWHAYYAVSTFASKVSAIGVATSPTLDPTSPAYGWTDQGIVVRSELTSLHNAIDPDVLVEGDEVRLTWGSFWGGIAQAPLDPGTGKLVPGAIPTTVASRLVPTWGLEAPSLVERHGTYYLFTSFDSCCRGVHSTYNIRVGRAQDPGGPFFDRAGVPLLLGGGTLVLAGDGDRRGPGHQSVLSVADRWHLAFHFYDADRQGTATLAVLPLDWTADGWPVARWPEP